jgi:cell division protease FtsH
MMLTRAELEDKLAGMLGGRAAEELVFGDVSTGAANDLERATATVRQMVCLYGMGESAGLMHCAREADGRGGNGLEGLMQRDCSEATAREIDEEVRGTLDRAYGRALELLRGHRAVLERVAVALLEKETLSKEAFEALAAREEST